MNQICFLIINFLLYFNFFELTNCDPIYEIVDYSNFLPMVRIDLINKSLKILPGRGFVDVLKMCIEMNRLKESYEMNDAEGAFLVYQWITNNINIKCNAKEESSVYIFDSGEGSVYEISSLFIKMVSHLNISSGTIRGYTRNYDQRTLLPTEPYNWRWNYILINDTYYLVDVSYGIGECLGDNTRFLRNNFFLE